jgi:hypothetical protein
MRPFIRAFRLFGCRLVQAAARLSLPKQLNGKLRRPRVRSSMRVGHAPISRELLLWCTCNESRGRANFLNWRRYLITSLLRLSRVLTISMLAGASP